MPDNGGQCTVYLLLVQLIVLVVPSAVHLLCPAAAASAWHRGYPGLAVCLLSAAWHCLGGQLSHVELSFADLHRQRHMAGTD